MKSDKELYKFLEDHHVFWGRDKDGNIFINTSGYKTHFDLGHYGLEKIMREHGYYMFDEEFDRISGTTMGRYKKLKKKNPKGKIAKYGAFRAKGASPYFQGRYKIYGPYQWSIKYYDWNDETEIELAREAFFYDDFYDLKQEIGRDVKIHIDGRSGGWLVIDEDLTEEEFDRASDWIERMMRLLPEVLEQIRDELY